MTNLDSKLKIRGIALPTKVYLIKALVFQLEKEMATHSSILAWRIPWTIHGVAKSRTKLSDFHFTSWFLQ